MTGVKTEATTEEQTPTAQTEQPASHETDWKAEARKWEARAKENKGAATELAKIKEASKSELEKTLERAQKAEEKVKAYEAQAQRTAWLDEVAKDTGLPADVLRGNTLEEIQAHAEKLRPYFDTPSAPVVKNDSMKSNTTTAGTTNADALFDIVQQKLCR